VAGQLDISGKELAKAAPKSIPARERRRAGQMISMAVEVAHQACDMAAVPKNEIPSVFTSAMCDTTITDYMCRKLASDEKLLSPTRFHNSVHNAASGYWSISAENRSPSSYVGGGQNSVGIALLETVSLVQETAQPVLMVGYDLQTKAPFDDVFPIGQTMAFALVLAPADHQATGQLNTLVDLSVKNESEPQSLARDRMLTSLSGSNPMGAAISLLEMTTDTQTSELSLALTPHSTLVVRLNVDS
jgi:hypothetical protein